MKNRSTSTKQVFIIVGAIAGGLALALQLYLSITNRIISVPEAITRYFSYYTILTNILVALCFTSLWLKRPGFFSRAKTLAATAVYILVVGIVYNAILRFTWNPQGLQRVADELLHLIIPIWFVLFWLLYAPKTGLQWTDVFPWLIYPFVYLLYVLFRGSFAGFYPYPFVDVNTLGYKGVVVNSLWLFAAFLLISLLFVAMAKKMTPKT